MDIRAEVKTFLSNEWDPDRPLFDWRGALADTGWGCPSWPREWFGRDHGREDSVIVAEEFARAGAVGVAAGPGMTLAGPTLLEHAGDDLKRRFLRRIVTGEDRWCQLFSEPGAGSDLAGLQTRAELSGDEWIVNGQKVWTTGAHVADFGLLVARTDWDVPKHRGISYFVLPMRQEGVDARPLRQMNRHASFNEVFMSDARIAHDLVVGELNAGWPIAMFTLAIERAAIGALRPGTVPTGGKGRAIEEAAAEAAEYSRVYAWYPSRMGRVDAIRGQVRDAGRSDDPLIRQRVAHLESIVRVDRWNTQRARAARQTGRSAGPEGSLSKLATSRITQEASPLHAQIHGAAAMLDGPDSPMKGTVAEITLSYRAQSIAGGTDEIQRNIIGERVLGLPKEPPVDVDIPFRDVKKS